MEARPQSLIRVGRPRALAGDRPGITARIQVGDEAHDVWYRVSEGPLAAGPETFLAASLAPAMKLGWPLQISGEVSPRLLAALPTIQTILRCWVPGCREVPVQVSPSETPQRIGPRGVACFFSAGVDSFFTLLKHREQIGTIILVHGFDLRLDDTEMRSKVSRSLREVAAELRVDLVEVETNVRAFADRYFPWKFYHGSMLASVALLLAPRFRKVYVAASDSYCTLIPWGSHPLLDPLWSTEEIELAHDGLEANRFEKVATIASSEVALRYLRVCFPWTSNAGAYNCGRCDKCMSTMACLRGVGALDRCATFPPELDLDALARLPPPDGPHRVILEEIFRSVKEKGADRELTEALSSWLQGRYHGGLRDMPVRVLGKMRWWARNGVARVRGRSP